MFFDCVLLTDWRVRFKYSCFAIQSGYSETPEKINQEYFTDELVD